ncbi:ATP-dependent DNA helicase sgs1 [Mortierella polycephala]|uniref:DNA 3'-5' helicase n=1 Tax=Mortierella polycephala TaxID=41804 RepID=A0A9P6QDV1_9FUNG|nr:ATP-dependent DNA helicase sgs1 [Mortierella polycephala]
MLIIPEDTVKRCQDVFKVVPKNLQLKAVEHIGQGQDCIFISDCDRERTLVYVLPLVLWSDCVVVVISPLKTSIQEQQQKLQDFGINSIFLDKEQSIGSNTLDELADGTFAAVFSTPEIIFHASRLRPLWNRTTWRRRLKAVVLDEAHCISTWGSPFREVDDYIGDLRSWIPPSVAFVALSTTLPPRTLEDVKSCARFKPGVTVFGVRSDRANIRLEIPGKLMSICELWPPDVNKRKIAVYHDYMAKSNQKIILDAFERDEILLLLSTEAHETDYDVNDVARVVQFKCPATISCLVQRFGRAARNPKLQGLGILLTGTESTTDPHLTQYITTKECRRKVLNAAFDNEDRSNGNCCDLCHPLSETFHLRPDVTFKEVQAVDQSVDQAVDQAKEVIRTWRSMVCKRDYIPLYSFFTEDCVMTDNMVERLGERVAEVTTPESIQSIITWMPLKKRLLEELASILIRLNEETMQSQHQAEQIPPQHQAEQIIPPQRQAEQIMQPQYQAELINDNQDEADNSHHAQVAQPLRSKPKPTIVFKNSTAIDISKQINKRRRKK